MTPAMGCFWPQHDIKSNAFRLQRSSDLWRIEALRMFDQHPCFDFDHYFLSNPDLPRDWDTRQLWSHFVFAGQFESREFRWVRGPLHKHLHACMGSPQLSASGRVRLHGSLRDAPFPGPPFHYISQIVAHCPWLVRFAGLSALCVLVSPGHAPMARP